MSQQASKASPLSPAAKTILLATLVAGTLDILSALIFYGYVFYNVGARHVLQGIARVLLGKKAFEGGWATAFLGLAMHYCIASSFVILYFLIFPYIPFLKKYKIASGLLYGVLVWMIMNLAVLPLVDHRSYHFKLLAVVRDMAILLYAIGLPISLLISRHYERPFH
jgi:hypothetical protein